MKNLNKNSMEKLVVVQRFNYSNQTKNEDLAIIWTTAFGLLNKFFFISIMEEKSL